MISWVIKGTKPQRGCRDARPGARDQQTICVGFSSIRIFVWYYYMTFGDIRCTLARNSQRAAQQGATLPAAYFIHTCRCCPNGRWAAAFTATTKPGSSSPWPWCESTRCMGTGRLSEDCGSARWDIWKRDRRRAKNTKDKSAA